MVAREPGRSKISGRRTCRGGSLSSLVYQISPATRPVLLVRVREKLKIYGSSIYYSVLVKLKLKFSRSTIEVYLLC